MAWLFRVPGLVIALILSGLVSISYSLWLSTVRYGMRVDLKGSLAALVAALASALPVLLIVYYSVLPSLGNVIIGGLVYLLAYLTLAPLFGAVKRTDLQTLAPILGQISILRPATPLCESWTYLRVGNGPTFCSICLLADEAQICAALASFKSIFSLLLESNNNEDTCSHAVLLRARWMHWRYGLWLGVVNLSFPVSSRRSARGQASLRPRAACPAGSLDRMRGRRSSAESGMIWKTCGAALSASSGFKELERAALSRPYMEAVSSRRTENGLETLRQRDLLTSTYTALFSSSGGGNLSCSGVS
jgi:hypothetical protein